MMTPEMIRQSYAAASAIYADYGVDTAEIGRASCRERV